jgi:hypothetical protein
LKYLTEAEIENSEVIVFGLRDSESQHRPLVFHQYVEPPSAITISACGKYVVVVHGNASNVVPIPERELDLPENLQAKSPTTDAAPKINNEQSVAHIGTMDVSSFNFRPGDVLKDLQVSIRSDGYSHQVLSIDSDGTVAVRMTNDSRVALQMEMVKLPQCQDESLTPSLIMPNGCHDAVRIVMNKKPMHAYTMNTTPSEKGPFIVDRDARSILYVVDPASSPSQQPIVAVGALKSTMSIPLGTAPKENKILGLRDGEGSRAFDVASVSDAADRGQEPPLKRLKY